MRYWTVWTFVQLMGHGLFRATRSFEPVNVQYFHWRECTWPYRLQNFGHFVENSKFPCILCHMPKWVASTCIFHMYIHTPILLDIWWYACDKNLAREPGKDTYKTTLFIFLKQFLKFPYLSITWLSMTLNVIIFMTRFSEPNNWRCEMAFKLLFNNVNPI